MGRQAKDDNTVFRIGWRRFSRLRRFRGGCGCGRWDWCRLRFQSLSGLFNGFAGVRGDQIFYEIVGERVMQRIREHALFGRVSDDSDMEQQGRRLGSPQPFSYLFGSFARVRRYQVFYEPVGKRVMPQVGKHVLVGRVSYDRDVKN